MYLLVAKQYWQAQAKTLKILLNPSTVCSCPVTYAFQSESTLYIWLNVKEFLAPNKGNIWSLSDCSGTRTHNDLVHKRTLNHLAKLTEWLSWVVSTYLYGAFECMFLSYHVRVSEWILFLFFFYSLVYVHINCSFKNLQ